MATTASALIERARSLADLANSKFINYDDEVSSLNESYRDIYSWLCNNDDDFFVKEYLATVTGSISNDPTAALVTLPADLYKLRFVDYWNQGNWQRVRKYSTEARDNNPGQPQYRFYGEDLRIIGMQSLGAALQLRLVYYPPADVITVPDYAYEYCSSYQPYQKDNISSPTYVAAGNYLIYLYSGTTIRSESIDYNTVAAPITLYTGTGMSNLAYNKGYVYFLQGGEIYRATTNLTATITPAAITSTTGSIVTFGIVRGMIYYSTATEIRSCALDGSSDTLVVAATGKDFSWYNGALAYINALGYMVLNGVATTIAALNLTSDGASVYYRDAADQVHLYTATDDVIMRVDVAYLGTYQASRLPIIDVDGTVQAISSIPDWQFTYPLNDVNEIIAYQCAIDFKRKQNADYSPLVTRMAELQRRFLDVMKRDEGLPQKIGNAYSQFDSQWR